MQFLFNIYYVSVNTKSMGLVGVECFLYIRYILVILWIMGECQAVFAFFKKNALLVKSAFDFFYLKAEFICWKINLTKNNPKEISVW